MTTTAETPTTPPPPPPAPVAPPPKVETRAEYAARVVAPAQAEADAALGALRSILQAHAATLSLDETMDPKVLAVLRYLCAPWDYLFHEGNSACPCLPTSDVWDEAEDRAIAACKCLARANNRAALLPEA
jgi:hypothetical protein